MPVINPANQVKISNLVFDGDTPMFGGNIKKGTSGKAIFCVLEDLIGRLFDNDALECIDLEKLGIKCPDGSKSKLCIITEWLVDGLNETNVLVSQLTLNIQTLQTAIGRLKDEKVKVKSAGTAGYLSDIIDAPPNSITFTNDKVTVMGLVPVGFRATINANRVGDFDNTGKGKIGTDMWGWAIRNGKNGLANHLGYFPMYADTTLSGDITGGNDSFTVGKENMRSFSIAINGTIGESLDNQVSFKIQVATRHKCFGIGGCRDVLVPDDGADREYETDKKDFKHSHTFNLAASNTNTSPTPIALIPKHIKEIPIERIIP